MAGRQLQPHRLRLSRARREPGQILVLFAMSMVVIMAAAISKTAPNDLVRRVAPALLAGLGVLVAAALLGVV